MIRNKSIIILVIIGCFLISCSKGFKAGLGPNFVGNGAVYGKVYLKDLADNSGIKITMTNTPLMATTSESGAFSIEGLGIGTYILTAEKEHYGSASIENIIISGAGVSYHVPDMTISINDGVINGSIKDPENQPVANVNISVNYTTQITTDINGNFSLSGITAGEYLLTASKSGYLSESINLSFTSGVIAADFKLYRVDQAQLSELFVAAPVTDLNSLVAESFIPSVNIIRKVRTFASNYVLEIRTDNSGKPSSTVIASKQCSSLPGDAIFASPVTVTPGNTYWLVYRSMGLGSQRRYGYSSYSGVFSTSSDNGNTWVPNVSGHHQEFTTCY